MKKIYLVLIAVAIFLYIEVKSLLLGESADPKITEMVENLADKHSEIDKLINCISIQQGPGEVLLCFKLKVKNNLLAMQISKMTNELEKEIRKNAPEVKWIYIETDMEEWKA